MGYCDECRSELSADVECCPVCGTHAPPSQRERSGLLALLSVTEDWDPRAPVLSVATSVLLLWAALHRLEAGPGGFFSYLFAGVLIVPRVRLVIGRLAGRKPANPFTNDLIAVLLFVLLYAILAGSAALVLYVAATNGRSYVVPVSRFAPVQAYVLAAVGVSVVRAVRPLRAA